MSRRWPGAFADHDLGRARAPARDGGAGHDQRVRVDGRARLVLHHVGLQEHAPAREVDPELAKPAMDEIGEVRGVVAGRKQPDRRPSGKRSSAGRTAAALTGRPPAAASARPENGGATTGAVGRSCCLMA